MCSIKNTDNCLMLNLNTFFDYGDVDDFFNPIFSSAMFFFEILNCLSLPNMFLPNLVGKLLRSTFVLKLFAAIWTSVVLNTSSLSVLLYPRISTVWALFLDIVCS